MKFYRDKNGNIYTGDKQPGDSELEKEEMDEYLLFQTREEKLQQFYADNANLRRLSTVEHEGKFFSISQDAKINLMAVVNQASLFGTPITYFEKNGNSAEYTLNEFKPVAAVVSQGIVAAENYYYTKEKEIKDAKSLEELEAITWEKL